MLERAADTGWLAGVKDGTFDVRHFRRIEAALHDRLVLAVAWEDAVLAYAPYGVDAFCPASNDTTPRMRGPGTSDCARVTWRARAHCSTRSGTRSPICALQRPGIDVDVVKEALRARGLDAGGVRRPGVAATAVERARARALLDQLDTALRAVAVG